LGAIQCTVQLWAYSAREQPSGLWIRATYVTITYSSAIIFTFNFLKMIQGEDNIREKTKIKLWEKVRHNVWVCVVGGKNILLLQG
jgi:hypothetical protein